jgi:flagellar motor switch protein FliM
MSTAIDHLRATAFQRPRRPEGDLGEVLDRWCAVLASQLQESWNSLLKRPCELQPGPVTVLATDQAQALLAPGCWGVRIEMNHDRTSALCLLSEPLIRSLLSALLDVSPEELLQEREISLVEQSLLDVLFHQIGPALGDSFPGRKSLPAKVVETLPRPERARAIAAGQTYYSFPLSASGLEQQPSAYVIVPRGVVDHWLEPVRTSRRGAGSGSFEHPLQSLVEQIPCEVTVILGSLELPMSQALSLSIGDVLVLDQQISKPLMAAVEGVPKLLGMPARAGSQQAYQIRELI